MTIHRSPTACSWAFTLLRIAIGWHLLYEGIVKLTAKHWTAAGYLADATWLLAGVFRRMAESPAILHAVDLLNMWGLTLIGLALVLGALTRTSAVLGALMLLLYYAANPPFVGLRGVTGEGSYLVVNKNLVEAVALLAIAVMPRAWLYGLDQLARSRKRQGDTVTQPASVSSHVADCQADGPTAQRRQVLRQLVGLPVLGAFFVAARRKRRWDSLEEKFLVEAQADGVSSATLKTLHFSKLKDLKGTMTYGRIGPLKVSRLILGGNLIGGWAHARDLMYVSDLVKAYHDDDRVIATFRLAEKCGVNTFLTNPKLLRIIRKYWKLYDGHIQYIADCTGADLHGMTRLAIDGGAHASYVQGATADKLVQDGKIDEIRWFLDTVRSHGLPAGIGAHRIETVKACIAANVRPDFWVKTLHHHNYRSAIENVQKQDNVLYSIFCPDPAETIEVMKQAPEPWIAFKVLAAGAIKPQDGFTHAFNSGADFICVGMYDFQMVDDVNTATKALAEVAGRPRPWRA